MNKENKILFDLIDLNILQNLNKLNTKIEQ